MLTTQVGTSRGAAAFLGMPRIHPAVEGVVA